MTWQEIRKQLPNRWLLIEALKAHSQDGRRIIDDYAIVGIYDEQDSSPALDAYDKLHQADRTRELYVVHTSEAEVEILERFWHGIRVAM